MRTELPTIEPCVDTLGSYTLEARHTNQCTIRRVNDIPVSRLKEFFNLVQKFIAQADEKEHTVESTVKMFKASFSSNKSVCMYLVEKNNVLCGYAFSEIIPTLYGSLCVVIHQLFLDRPVRRMFIVRELERMGAKWARQQGATEAAFITRRNSKAFIRLLNKKWSIDSTVLKRSI